MEIHGDELWRGREERRGVAQEFKSRLGPCGRCVEEEMEAARDQVIDSTVP